MTSSAPNGVAPLLEVRDLRVAFSTPDGLLEAVSGLSFSVARGQVLGIVGESGSGKSAATQSMVGLTRGARVTGEALFEQRDLLAMSPDELRAVRGPGIAMVFQNPLSSLHPLYRIGWQIVEMIQAHEPVTKRQARARDRTARSGRYSASGSPRRRLPAPVLRRDAAARDDRDGAGAQSAPAGGR